MYIIKTTENENGSRPPIQTWDSDLVPTGFSLIPDDLDLTNFYKYNGFVNLTIDEETGIVKDVQPNVEAWKNWNSSLPPEKEPKPTRLDAIEAQVTYTAMMTDTLPEG